MHRSIWVIVSCIYDKSRNVRKCTFGNVRQEKIQIILRMRAVSSDSSLDAFWIAKDAKFLHADNEDSDQTAHMSEGTFSHISAHKLPFA